MRTVKTTTITILAIGLLAGSAIGVTAQDEEPAAEEPTGASYFTGELNLDDGRVADQPEETIVDGVLEVRVVVFEDEAIEASDPRISGSLARVLNANVHKLGDFEDLVHETNSWRIENEGGSWSGHGNALVHQGGTIDREDATNLDTIVLTGEGGYEGLSAYVLADWTEDPVAVEGAVFASVAPPIPDFPEATAE